jgi:hypothetical protein
VGVVKGCWEAVMMLRMPRILAVVLVGCVSATSAAAQELVVNVGPPVAATGQQIKKGNVFVVRPGGCAEPAAAHFSGGVEGILNGARQRMPLQLEALPTPGVHAIRRNWPEGGVWVVSVQATCGGRTAGAVVALKSDAVFRREGVTLLAHAPTPHDVESSLKAIAAR